MRIPKSFERFLKSLESRGLRWNQAIGLISEDFRISAKSWKMVDFNTLVLKSEDLHILAVFSQNMGSCDRNYWRILEKSSKMLDFEDFTKINTKVLIFGDFDFAGPVGHAFCGDFLRVFSISNRLILNGDNISITTDDRASSKLDFGRRLCLCTRCINKAQKQKTSFACLLRIGVE
jgi:hypothetical protein